MLFEHLVNNIIDEILLTPEDINNIVDTLAQEMMQHYQDKSVVLVGIMNGCFPFMSNLAQRIALPLHMEYIRISAYGAGINCDENCKSVRTLSDFSLEGKDVIIIDEILDRGVTLFTAYNWIKNCNPKSIKTCVLLERQMERIHMPHADFTGYVLQTDQWVIGYGCDYQLLYRNLPYIATIKKELCKG